MSLNTTYDGINWTLTPPTPEGIYDIVLGFVPAQSVDPSTNAVFEYSTDGTNYVEFETINTPEEAPPTIVNSVTIVNKAINQGIVQFFIRRVDNGNPVGLDSFFIDGISSGGEGVPCLTKTCNVLTPSGYRNVAEIKQGDVVTTSDNRQVEIQRILTSTLPADKVSPRLIKAHQFGKNQPLIDTHLSDWHAFNVNGMWQLPKKSNLPKQWSEEQVTFYHLELPDYYNDNLVVNGMVMESWDGKLPTEVREYVWKKIGKKYVRQMV